MAMRPLLSAVVMVKGRALSAWVRVLISKADGDAQATSKNKAVANVFTRRAVIAGTKGIQRITHSVDVVKQFAEDTSPGLCFRKRVICNQVEAMTHVSL